MPPTGTSPTVGSGPHSLEVVDDFLTPFGDLQFNDARDGEGRAGRDVACRFDRLTTAE